MKNGLLFTAAVIAMLSGSCGDSGAPKKTEPVSLIDIKDGMYTEYYPGRKAIKFKGPQDENGLRHGHWYAYNANGNEQSMTEFSHGKKNGISYARYPEGTMRYIGEYTSDVQTGIWRTYDHAGKVADEKDYGTGITDVIPETAP